MPSTLTPTAAEHPLRLSLRADALVCAVFLPVLVLGAGFLSGPLGLSNTLLVTAGLILLPCAVLMWWSSTAPTVRTGAVSAVLLINVLWVLGSVGVVVLASPTPLGVAFVLVQAAAVAAILAAEALTLRRAGEGRTVGGTV